MPFAIIAFLCLGLSHSSFTTLVLPPISSVFDHFLTPVMNTSGLICVPLDTQLIEAAFILMSDEDGVGRRWWWWQLTIRGGSGAMSSGEASSPTLPTLLGGSSVTEKLW